MVRAARPRQSWPVMDGAILHFVETLMGSPWVYAALFAFAALDGFFPLVPSESLVITAGVFAAAGEPILPLVILVAAAGAFVGDHVAYLFGRTAGGRLVEQRPPGYTQAQGASTGPAGILDVRGGLIVVVCRYIPGARTAITMTAGAVRYPLRRFSFFDGIAALSWGAYSALVGYVGGAAFEDDPFKGLALGLGLALGGHRRRRGRAPPAHGAPAGVQYRLTAWTGSATAVRAPGPRRRLPWYAARGADRRRAAAARAGARARAAAHGGQPAHHARAAGARRRAGARPAARQSSRRGRGRGRRRRRSSSPPCSPPPPERSTSSASQTPPERRTTVSTFVMPALQPAEAR